MKLGICFFVSLLFVGFLACNKGSDHPTKSVADSTAIINPLRAAIMKHSWNQDSTTWMEGGNPWRETMGGTGNFVYLNFYQDSLLHITHDMTKEYRYSIWSDSSMIWEDDSLAYPATINYKILGVTDTQLKLQWKTVIIGLDSTTYYTDYYHAR